ncbi:hypothetical protein [Amycolatopsis sp. DG1A-15b]|uniref:hypothetical protein n=1 Tax=Amycolatopsis sp. DG1A-15b TaxID=3052846 RepID=UPI00255C14CE|nr:hypothetical protein [Amycolatopsis sp. DG1A-15b]WIX85284.1 hypothetical protein QRY02_29100 [Amycolatopsis sp. DG1A-15b]
MRNRDRVTTTAATRTRGFTLRTYMHLVSSSHQRAREAVDAMFGRPALDDGLEVA